MTPLQSLFCELGAVRQGDRLVLKVEPEEPQRHRRKTVRLSTNDVDDGDEDTRL